MAQLNIGFETQVAEKVFGVNPKSGVVDNVNAETLPGGLAGGWKVLSVLTGDYFDAAGEIGSWVQIQDISSDGGVVSLSVFNLTDTAGDFTVKVLFGRLTVSSQ